MRIALGLLITLSVLALVASSFLALVPADTWWVRMMDFPRLQYLILLAVLALVLAAVPLPGRRVRLALGLLVLLAAGYNVTKLLPYRFGAIGGPPGFADAAPVCSEEDRFSVLVANVQLTNRRDEDLLAIVRSRGPDLFLALETDEWWDRQLSALRRAMPHGAQHITGSYFGIHLFSRLPLQEAKIVFPAEQDTPAITSLVELPSGNEVRFVGLHPRPPHPGQSSAGRDAQLAWAAMLAREPGAPVLIAGDLNAVPWETTLEQTQRLGGFLDPRQEFGFLPTYDANSWWMSWPLDQVLHQPALTVLSYEVLPSFGSDHYPIEVTLCHAPTEAVPPKPRPGDLARAERTLAKALEGPPERR